MTEPHPVLAYLADYIRDMTWRDCVVVRDALHDYLNHEINDRQLNESEHFARRFTGPTLAKETS